MKQIEDNEWAKIRKSLELFEDMFYNYAKCTHGKERIHFKKAAHEITKLLNKNK